MDLSVKVPCGDGFLTLKNPVMPAAGGFGNVIEYLDFVDVSRLGAVIPNSFLPHEGSVNPVMKYFMTEHGYLSAHGINNVTLDAFVERILPRLPWEATPVIVNLKAITASELRAMIRLARESGKVAGVEINGNFPYGDGEEPEYWTDREETRKMFHSLREEAGGMLLISKTPTTDKVDIEAFTLGSEEGGADGVSTFNSIPGCEIDIFERTFVCGRLGYGGYAGPGVKPYALWRCFQAARVSKKAIYAAGGAATAEDVIQYIMAGAHAVQVGSSNLLRPDFLERLLDDLEALMEKLGLKNFDEIRGCVATREQTLERSSKD